MLLGLSYLNNITVSYYTAYKYRDKQIDNQCANRTGTPTRPYRPSPTKNHSPQPRPPPQLQSPSLTTTMHRCQGRPHCHSSPGLSSKIPRASAAKISPSRISSAISTPTPAATTWRNRKSCMLRQLMADSRSCTL